MDSNESFFSRLAHRLGIIDRRYDTSPQSKGGRVRLAQEEQRTIALNDSVRNQVKDFSDNKISTTKYTVVTFLFKFLYEQFSKYANLFFLFIGCIQQIPGLSPVNRLGTLLPLSIVILASAAKEVAEDSKRAKQDAIVNATKVKTLHGSQFVDKKWKDVVVGDIVRVENGQFFPADLILLSSSEPDALCYIETSNLDGETNLKIRQGIPETAHLLDPDSVSLLSGEIKSELPNNSLYTYEGTITFDGGKTVPLDPGQLLLRGAMLRNTRWIYGIVVFTGHETKLMRNATAAPIKSTKVERSVNKQIIFLFITLMALSILCSLGALLRTLSSNFESDVLLIQRSFAVADFFWNILTFMILFNNLIPLSLIVTMEFVKYYIASLINADLDMYYEVNDTPATARTSSLVEELGQVDFIFSDKTGTLTCNIMEFKMCSIAGIAYAETVPEDKKAVVDDRGVLSGYHDFKTLLRNAEVHETAGVIADFCTLLSVCHTVIPERDESDPKNIIYQASSPDEGALVKGVQLLGYTFTTRRPKSVSVEHSGYTHEYEVLNICEFNSTRKRMSAVIRMPDGSIKLYIKGADTVIFERLAKRGNPYVDSTMIHLEDYANEGLRTLCLAYRDISESEYQEWSRIYDRAATTINNRSEALDDAAELIEKDLILLGATAIEDKLQDGVPDTIHTLANAGIKLWVLTGDRQETAINIGFSCKLLTEEMTILVCNESTHLDTKMFLMEKLDYFRKAVAAAEAEAAASRKEKYSGFGKEVWELIDRGGEWLASQNGAVGMFRKIVSGEVKGIDKDKVLDLEPFALVIDGRTLDFALEPDVKLIFLELACLCKAVVCCRVSPLQKALVVSLVKQNVDGAITLAIGDGANDVGMIQAAHVGVGISGMEGLQAARSADVAIAQFRYLEKLLLVHGGWAYDRLSKLVLYCFYKNITLYLIQFWFAFDNGFSGQTIFESWMQSCYNVMFTLCQPVALGIFDQYVNSRMLIKYPQLYRLGQRSEFYNNKTFIFWVANSFLHSFMIYWFMKVTSSESQMLADGRVVNIWLVGMNLYTIDIILVTLKAAITVNTWTWFTRLAVLGSLVAWMTLFPLYAWLAPMINLSPELYGIPGTMYSSWTFWFSILVVPVMPLIRDFVWKYYKRSYWPRSYHIIQEMQAFNIQDYRPRMDWFKKAVYKARQIQRLKRSRGFAFSQTETGQANLIRNYDTTIKKPSGL
ncbi:phospholipid-translocating P-type ATPase [Rhizoclosmatium globosum]|uniref:Phospholipid-transporting ATPase n=1 Tax=Rhizoclosmatium globosum TaxID=329046 RepID=A0A1Y2BR74_9FUNG|nr:phospholipid-translocating P-type ATPase [Rhizoclosmatium globosum]|eukprot:ORY37234.1 phospholipid-translocating P-type ATPase [Rhizoclosmatium globosum]